MREYYLRCSLYDSMIPLKILVEWQKATIDYIGNKICEIVNEYILIKSEEEYEFFCDKYKNLINYRPQFKKLNRDILICSHAFINTVEFTNQRRIRVDFSSDKDILINRFNDRENIKNNLDEKLKLYYKSYEEVLLNSKANSFDTTKMDVIDKILELL